MARRRDALDGQRRTAPARVLGGGPVRPIAYAPFGGVDAARGTQVVCQDGDPACDVDGTQDGAATFGVSACLAQDDVAGCTPPMIERVTMSVMPRSAARTLGIAPAGPSRDAQHRNVVRPENVVRVPLRVSARGMQRPSRVVTFRMVALAATAPRRDVDTVHLRCVPNVGGGQCPANPAGGPRELRLTTPGVGTDLDNGFTGLSHNFPVPSNARLRVCLAGCDGSSDTRCAEDEAATKTANAKTFGAPLPLLAVGAPVCVVNRFAPANRGFHHRRRDGSGERHHQLDVGPLPLVASAVARAVPAAHPARPACATRARARDERV